MEPDEKRDPNEKRHLSEEEPKAKIPCPDPNHVTNWDKVRSHHAEVKRLNVQLVEARAQHKAACENAEAILRQIVEEETGLVAQLYGEGVRDCVRPKSPIDSFLSALSGGR